MKIWFAGRRCQAHKLDAVDIAKEQGRKASEVIGVDLKNRYDTAEFIDALLQYIAEGAGEVALIPATEKAIETIAEDVPEWENDERVPDFLKREWRKRRAGRGA